MQASMAVLPSPIVLEFVGQLIQASAPTSDLYEPAAQASHVSAGSVISPVCPGSHRQSVSAVLSVPAVVAFVGHAVQVADPALSLYCPTAHASHVSAGAAIVPEKPASHSQSVTAVLPVPAVFALAVHAVHASGPRVSLYSPTSHVVHSSAGAWMSPV